MNNFVRAALDLVRADAEASCVPGPVYVDGDWEFYDDFTVGSPELIVTGADRVQDDMIEHLCQHPPRTGRRAPLTRAPIR